MRAILLIAAALLTTGPAYAAAKPKPHPKPAHAKMAHMTHRAPAAMGDGTQRPVDVGPFTPEANRAFQGGGTSTPAPARP